MAKRSTLVSLAALLALVSTGCGGSGEPQPLPRPTAKPSSSESASTAPTAPAMPAAAKEKTKAGASAAVGYFMRAMKYAGETGQTTEYEASYTRECTRCSAITDGIRRTYDQGGSITGGGWIPKRIKVYVIEGDLATVDAIVNYEPQEWTESANATPNSSPARTNVLKALQVVWRGERWRVATLDAEQ